MREDEAVNGKPIFIGRLTMPLAMALTMLVTAVSVVWYVSEREHSFSTCLVEQKAEIAKLKSEQVAAFASMRSDIARNETRLNIYSRDLRNAEDHISSIKSTLEYVKDTLDKIADDLRDDKRIRSQP